MRFCTVLAAGLVLLALAVPCSAELPAGALIRLGTNRYRAQAAALSPDGKLLAVGDCPELRLVDPRTWKEVRACQSQDSPRWSKLDFSPDGQFLAAYGEDGVLVYRAKDGQVHGTVKLPPQVASRVYSVSFSANGKRLALGTETSGWVPPHFAVINIADMKILKQSAIGRRQNLGVVLSPDGKLLALRGSSKAGATGSVLLWDVGSWKKSRQLKTTAHQTTAFAFSPDGKQLVAVMDGVTLNCWDVATGKQIGSGALHADTTFVAYAPNGKWIVTGARNGRTEVWSAASVMRIRQYPAPARAGVSSVAFLPSNQMLILGTSGRALCLWEVPSGKEIPPRGGHNSPITSLAFTADGKVLLSAGEDGLRRWQVATGKELRRLETKRLPGWRHDLAHLISPGGKYLVRSAQTAGNFAVVDLSLDEEAALLPAGTRTGAPVPGAFTPDGASFACFAMDDALRVWELGSFRRVRTIKPGTTADQCLALALTGKTLALASSRSWPLAGVSVSIRDLASTKEVARQQYASVASLAFSPDGTLLAVAHATGVHLSDAVSGRVVRNFPTQGPPSALAVAPDGRTLAIGVGTPGESNNVLLLEAVSGQVRATFTGHLGAVRTLAFSPDGRTLASGGEDTSVVLWDVQGLRGLALASGKATEAELAGWWADLGGEDAGLAHRAMAHLTAEPVQAVALFSKELKPVPGTPLTEKEIRQFIADLDDDHFRARQKASKALVEAGHVVRPFLEAALKQKPGPEQRRGLRSVSRKLAAADAAFVRTMRALEVMERVGTPQARRILQGLARGKKNARLTLAAAATLRRLSRWP